MGARRRHRGRHPAHSGRAPGSDRPFDHAHHWHRLDAGLLLRGPGAGIRRPYPHRSGEALLQALPRHLGEKVVGGFSLSLVSMVLMLPGIGLWLAAMLLGGIKGLLVGTV